MLPFQLRRFLSRKGTQPDKGRVLASSQAGLSGCASKQTPLLKEPTAWIFSTWVSRMMTRESIRHPPSVCGLLEGDVCSGVFTAGMYVVLWLPKLHGSECNLQQSLNAEDLSFCKENGELSEGYCLDLE